MRKVECRLLANHVVMQGNDMNARLAQSARMMIDPVTGASRNPAKQARAMRHLYRMPPYPGSPPAPCQGISTGAVFFGLSNDRIQPLDPSARKSMNSQSRKSVAYGLRPEGPIQLGEKTRPDRAKPAAEQNGKPIREVLPRVNGVISGRPCASGPGNVSQRTK